MYAKVYASLWDGTLGGHWEAWSLFVFMLANCDREGFLDMTPEAIGRRSGMPVEAVKRGIQILEEPDRHSRRAEMDGRRLERIDDHRDWGWRIVNYGFYRTLVDEDTRRAQWRESKRARRQAVAAQQASTNVPSCPRVSTHAEADVEAEESKTLVRSLPLAESVSHPNRNGNGKPHREPKPEKIPDGFIEAYREYPRHEARRAAAKAFTQALARHPTLTPDDLLFAAKRYAKDVKREHIEPRFVPMPATWLNQDRFLEYFEEEP